MSTVDTIKERLSITDVVGSYIKLEKAGANYKGLCPFHHEKSPSFFVSPARNSFYCFGCSAKGDIFSFVEQFEGVDFMGALHILAERAGVEIVKENPQAKSEKERIYKALEHAAFFYHKELSGNTAAREYLTKRGVTVATMKDWQLGYAPAEWRALYTYLTGKGYTADELMKAGLVKPTDNGHYDVFRSRIVFPISDSSGRIVGFSGRIFPHEEGTAKYLNTPETVLFNKSQVLYGYDKAKMNIRSANRAVLVEGQMDLILSHQVGINTAVATSGTAFTELHAQAIKRFAETLILCFDGDNAGIAAAQRGASIALSQGLEVRIAFLPDGKDPADLAIENKAVYEAALKNAVHIVEFALNMVLKKTTDARERAKLVVTDVLPFVKSITNSVEQSHFISLIAKRTGLREDALWEECKKATAAYTVDPEKLIKTQNTAVPGTTSAATVITPTRPRLSRTLESQLWGVLYLLEAGTIKPKSWDPPKLKERLIEILGETQFETLKNTHDPNQQELLLYAEITYDSPDRLDADIAELLYRLEEETLKQSLTQIMQQFPNDLTEAEQQALQAKANAITQKLSSLHKKRI